MARPNVTDFAASTLATVGGINNSAMSFAVQPGDGTLFPSVSSSLTLPYQPSNFVVAIESEKLLCSGRSSDTITVAQRGYDGTSAAAHAQGATVVIAAHRGQFNHIWGNLPDTHNPDVPPYARGGIVSGSWNYLTGGTAPSTYDDEFETYGGLGTPWNVYPVPTNLGGSNNGGKMDFGQSLRSCFSFRRTDLNTDTWFLWRSFTPTAGTSFTVDAKLSHGGRMLGQSPSSPDSIIATMFISDQTNPSGGPDVGNAVRILHSLYDNNVYIKPHPYSSPIWSPAPMAIAAMNNNGSYVRVPDPSYTLLSPNSPCYFRIHCLTGGQYRLYVGDGLTWHTIALINKSFAVHSLGFHFFAAAASNSRTEQHVVVDYVRVNLSPDTTAIS